MARNRANDDDDGGLDSLLDTMTNVVGILVIVLVVTQLGVGDAVSRITASLVIDKEQIDQDKRELTQLTVEQSDLNNQIKLLADVDVTAQRKELEASEIRLNNQRRRAEQEQRQANEYALKMETDKAKASAIKKELEDNEKNRLALQKSIEQALARKATVEAKLDDTPVPQAVAAKVVTLPNPRPAPSGAKPIYFVCQKNQVYPIFLDPVRDASRQRAENVVVARRLIRDIEKGADPDEFLKEYKKIRTRPHDFFEVEMYVSGGRYPRLKFTPRENKGVSEAELRNPRSNFRKMMQTVDPTKYYARFFVMPDSFDVYLTARAVMSEMQLPGGWEPQNDTWQLTTHVGGPLRLGPPKPDPPPGPPGKPQNLID